METEFYTFAAIFTNYTYIELKELWSKMGNKRITDYITTDDKLLWYLRNLSGR